MLSRLVSVVVVTTQLPPSLQDSQTSALNEYKKLLMNVGCAMVRTLEINVMALSYRAGAQKVKAATGVLTPTSLVLPR